MRANFDFLTGAKGHRPGSTPPSRFGELKVEATKVEAFSEKPEFADNWINGGYFLIQRDFLSYLSPDVNCVLERNPLVQLAHDGQLSMFKHRGFWACVDTQRDLEYLNKLGASGQAPWAI